MTPLSPTQRKLVSEAEFLALPASTAKTELLDGEVIVSPSPSGRHQMLVLRIASSLLAWAKSRNSPAHIGIAPYDVRFAFGQILQPDVFVVLQRVDVDHVGPLDVIPDLCIEVISENRVYDRVTKRAIYAAAGVREFWAVEQLGPIERWGGTGLAIREEITDLLVSSLLPGFELELNSLFAI